MTKGFVKRHQFQIIALAASASQDVQIEADECYLRCITASSSVFVVRERERQLAKAMTDAGLTWTNNMREVCVLSDSFLEASLDTRPHGAGNISKEITSDVGYPNRQTALITGYKERITLTNISTTTAMKVLVETVHYVPAETIAA